MQHQYHSKQPSHSNSMLEKTTPRSTRGLVQQKIMTIDQEASSAEKMYYDHSNQKQQSQPKFSPPQ